MIRRLLIANRGEIALRIIRACEELHIASVAVYSDADAQTPHVHAANQAVRLGLAPAADSYLAVARVLQAARESDADAIHPGYGFLAENPRFAAACTEAGIVFVGPTADAMLAMGSKIGARAMMQRAGVPVVPGETPPDQSDDAIRSCARRIGYPVLIKASAGGGGKGMRIVRSDDDLTLALDGARHEARSAFGDDTLYVERLIERARHVEIQLLADHHGHVVHLFERDCSTQRRHQKVIEESPSPVLTPALRERMGAAAVAAAKAVGYRNAGTIEFLLEGAGDDAHFYFLEMNTRLQVEHPVTEAVTGLDLVQAQLRIAGGAPLPWTQDDLRQRGHAIECRVYAEDPSNGFLPQAGRIDVFDVPVRPGVRIDAGIVSGSEITVHYDPMVAKITAYGETRDAAIAKMRATLAGTTVLGVKTNVAFLNRVLDSAAFREARIDTNFLDREGDALLPDPPLPPAALAAVVCHQEGAGVPGQPSGSTSAAERPDPWVTVREWRG